MLEAIRSAKTTVNFAAYIVKSDEIGHQFRDALCERARAGVEVRVLLDGVGSGWDLDNSDVRMMTKTFGEALTGAGQFPNLPAAGDLKAQTAESHSFSAAAPIPMVQAVAFAAAEKRIWNHEPVLHAF